MAFFEGLVREHHEVPDPMDVLEAMEVLSDELKLMSEDSNSNAWDSLDMYECVNVLKSHGHPMKKVVDVLKEMYNLRDQLIHVLMHKLVLKMLVYQTITGFIPWVMKFMLMMLMERVERKERVLKSLRLYSDVVIARDAFEAHESFCNKQELEIALMEHDIHDSDDMIKETAPFKTQRSLEYVLQNSRSLIGGYSALDALDEMSILDKNLNQCLRRKIQIDAGKEASPKVVNPILEPPNPLAGEARELNSHGFNSLSDVEKKDELDLLELQEAPDKPEAHELHDALIMIRDHGMNTEIAHRLLNALELLKVRLSRKMMQDMIVWMKVQEELDAMIERIDQVDEPTSSRYRPHAENDRSWRL